VYSDIAKEGQKIIEQLRGTQPKFLRNVQTPLKVDSGLTINYTNEQNGKEKENETVSSKPNELDTKPALDMPPPAQYNTQAEKRDECNCTVF
jgi:hypothetical protein